MLDWLRGLSGYNRRGEEVPDPKPMAIPVGFSRPPTLEEKMVQFVHNAQVKQQIEQAGLDSFDDANDFEVPDEPAIYGNIPDNNDAFDEEMEHAIAHQNSVRGGVSEDLPDVRRVAAEEAARKLRAGWKPGDVTPPTPPPTSAVLPKEDK